MTSNLITFSEMQSLFGDNGARALLMCIERAAGPAPRIVPFSPELRLESALRSLDKVAA